MIREAIHLKIYFRFAPVPSRMIALTRLLAKVGSITRMEALEYLHPSSTRSKNQPDHVGGSSGTWMETEQVKEVIDAAEECGLVKIEGPNKTVRLSPDLSEEETTLAQIDTTFPVTMARLVLRPEVNGRDNLFAQVCAWILCQPLVGLPEDHSGWKKTLSGQGLDLDHSRLRNDAAWDMVFYWMRYLGLIGRTAYDGVKGLVPDPTVFLTRHLHRLLPAKDEQVTAKEFLERLGRICPVLDGGEVHQAVRVKYKKDWPSDLLSEALSFALNRLQIQKILKYWCPDDQRVFYRTSSDEQIAYLARV